MYLPFSIDQVITFCLVFVRTSAIIFTVPIFGTEEVPAVAKIGLTVLLTWLIFPTVALPAGVGSMHFMALVPAMIAEVMLGIVIGLVARMFFEAVQLGGQLIGFQMGFGIVNVMDPVTGSRFSIIAQVQNLIAILIFLSLGLYHLFFQAMVISFEKIPLLQCYVSASLVEWLLAVSSNVFVLAVKIASPVIAVLLCASLVMGLINKGAQGMNVMIVMFPLKIACGLFGVAVCLPYLAIMLKKSFSHLEGYLNIIINLSRAAV